MRAAWLSSLGLALGVWTGGTAAADGVVWRPVAPATTPATDKREPVVTMGQPIPIASGRPVPPAGPVVPVTWSAPATGPRFVVRAQADGLPPPAPPPSGLPPVGPPPPPPPPGGIPWSPSEGYNSGVVPDTGQPGGPGFWDKTKNLFDLQSGPFCGSGLRKPFQSDHAFDGFISPVTNPFLFEDPRALTELRPIFLFQSVPNKNFAFRGGDIEFFGVQARVALTERLSLVLNKLGGIWENPHDSPFPEVQGHHSGFAEINIGPKYTFLRNERSGTLGAFGVTFEIPAGTSRTFQDTGNLSVVPYLTLGQNFGRSSYGSFNALGEIGYAFGADNKRSDSFFTSLHLDYDVANLHKIYPLLELNWTHYTTNGKREPFNFEGGDLINFGSQGVSGHENLTLAPGVRYKFSEALQLGTAVEFPIIGTKDLMDFRWTLDFILRY